MNLILNLTYSSFTAQVVAIGQGSPFLVDLDLQGMGVDSHFGLNIDSHRSRSPISLTISLIILLSAPTNIHLKRKIWIYNKYKHVNSTLILPLSRAVQSLAHNFSLQIHRANPPLVVFSQVFTVLLLQLAAMIPHWKCKIWNYDNIHKLHFNSNCHLGSLPNLSVHFPIFLLI